MTVRHYKISGTACLLLRLVLYKHSGKSVALWEESVLLSNSCCLLVSVKSL